MWSTPTAQLLTAARRWPARWLWSMTTSLSPGGNGSAMWMMTTTSTCRNCHAHSEPRSLRTGVEEEVAPGQETQHVLHPAPQTRLPLLCPVCGALPDPSQAAAPAYCPHPSPYSGGHFMSTAERIRLPDDCTVGYIVEALLGVPLIRSGLFHSHLENLQQVPASELHEQPPWTAPSLACLPALDPTECGLKPPKTVRNKPFLSQLWASGILSQRRA
ncbi:uncharacterized protein LOC100727311 isoform X2 [Cavia porcellus]